MTTSQRQVALARAERWQAMTSEVKAVIIDRLDLPLPPEWLTDDQPLFGRGLELDSIDALELSMAIDQKFQLTVYEEDIAIFGSINSFLNHLVAHREKAAAVDNVGAETASSEAVSADAKQESSTREEFGA